MDKKTELEEKLKKFQEALCSIDYHLGKIETLTDYIWDDFSEGTEILHEMITFFRHATKSSFQVNTLLASGDKIFAPLLEYLPPSQTRANPTFVFPRLNDAGEPYFTGMEKSISFSSEFRVQTNTIDRKMKFYFKMKPKDMFFDGKFEM